MTKVYHRYSLPDRSTLSRHEPGETATVQAAAAECDINNIVRRLLEGRDAGVPVNHGGYSDVSGHVDMKTNLDIIRRHQSSYNELSPEIRERYKTPLEYYNAQQQALEKEAGTRDSLDVSGPTDSEHAVSSKKGATNEEATHVSKVSKKAIQKSDRHEAD